ncbi:hypothetical protein ACLOJK_027248 [Asimina triloba]
MKGKAVVRINPLLPMAASTSSAVSLSPPSTLVDGKAPRQQAPVPRIAIPTLPPSSPGPQGRSSWKPTAYCHRIARNVMAMATGESQVMASATADAPTEPATELSEIVKTVKETWDKTEDKYAVTSLAVAAVVAVWGSAGMISVISQLSESEHLSSSLDKLNES